MTQADWPERLTRVVAGEVRRYRLERKPKMSTQQLEERTAEFGMRIPRSVLANLESGRRETLSIAELNVLAAALEVPPALLLFPLGRRELVDVLPDTPQPPWEAYKWFTGERDLTVFTGPGGARAAVFTAPAGRIEIRMFRDHELFQRAWQRAWWSLQNATKAVREAGTGEEAESERATARRMTEQVDVAEDDLRQLRRRMREQGLIPPALPEELAHIDETAWAHTVSVRAALPVQVRPAAEILGMGRPVLLDLGEMEASDRERVTELASALMREIHGTAELLRGGEMLRLTPATEDRDAGQALAGFIAQLDAPAEGER